MNDPIGNALTILALHLRLRWSRLCVLRALAAKHWTAFRLEREQMRRRRS